MSGSTKVSQRWGIMTAPSVLTRSYSPFETRGPMSSMFRKACSMRYCIPLI
jgi:hypothetical protein